MRAITIDPGGIAGSTEPHLRWSTAPEPELRPGEVLIDVAAAGVNRADLLQARGGYTPPPGASPILGLECSGTIAAIHDAPGFAVGDGEAPGFAVGDGDAPGFAVGDRVCALLSGGGYAERVAVPVGQVLPVPAGVCLEDAAALPEVICTVWSNLVMTARLAAGEFVLLHGGTSGIGTAAIQIARHLGARVAVTASTPEKLAACADLGAEVGINYRDEDFVDAVLRETAGHGAGVILDVVGASYLSRNIAALADGGRLVVIGLMGGAKAELDLFALMSRRASVTGTLLRSRPATGHGSKSEVVAAVRQHVWPMIEAGAVAPVIGARKALADAEDAHRLLRAGEVIGKIVLTR